jgi:hypothetical protein
LPGFGFTAEKSILSRHYSGDFRIKLKPSGTDHGDADLDVLGRDDFMLHNNNLRNELALLGQEFSDFDWYANQLQFLRSHTYFTASARALRNAGQLNNIRVLEKWLAGI